MTSALDAIKHVKHAQQGIEQISVSPVRMIDFWNQGNASPAIKHVKLAMGH